MKFANAYFDMELLYLKEGGLKSHGDKNEGDIEQRKGLLVTATVSLFDVKRDVFGIDGFLIYMTSCGYLLLSSITPSADDSTSVSYNYLHYR